MNSEKNQKSVTFGVEVCKKASVFLLEHYEHAFLTGLIYWDRVSVYSCESVSNTYGHSSLEISVGYGGNIFSGNKFIGRVESHDPVTDEIVIKLGLNKLVGQLPDLDKYKFIDKF